MATIKLSELPGKLEESHQKLLEKIKILQARIASEMINVLEAATPVKTGNLRRHWKMIQKSPTEIAIVNTAEYATFVVPKFIDNVKPKLDSIYKKNISEIYK